MNNKESFGSEIAKQLPIKEAYNDLVQPTLSTVGKALQGVTRVALAPISALVWGYDKIADYIDVALPQYFEKRKIKKERIISPDPEIAVPIIESMRYTSHKEELRKMFINLLGASMNKDCIDEHPSFVYIIKQLSSDECKILKYLVSDNIMPMLKICIEDTENGGKRDATPYFSDIGYISSCLYPRKFPEYLDNLHRLGLVEVYYDKWIKNDIFYQLLKKHPEFPKVVVTGTMKVVEQKGMYELSEFGKKFCNICITSD